MLLTYVIDYDFYGKLQKMAEKEPVYLLNPDFSDKIKLSIAVDKSFYVNIIDKVEELSAAKADLIDTKEIFFTDINGKVEIL